jgi:hypothetical protein
LQFTFAFDIPSSSYHLHFTTYQDASSQQQLNGPLWSPDELQTLEKFFNETFFPLSPISNDSQRPIMPPLDVLSLAAVSPRSTLMLAFQKLFCQAPIHVLRDLVKIIRLDQVSVTNIRSIHNEFDDFRIRNTNIGGVFDGV